MGATVVLEGGNHPALRLGRREPRRAPRKSVPDTVRYPMALGQSRHLASYVNITVAIPEEYAATESGGPDDRR